MRSAPPPAPSPFWFEPSFLRSERRTLSPHFCNVHSAEARAVGEVGSNMSLERSLVTFDLPLISVLFVWAVSMCSSARRVCLRQADLRHKREVERRMHPKTFEERPTALSTTRDLRLRAIALSACHRGLRSVRIRDARRAQLRPDSPKGASQAFSRHGRMILYWLGCVNASWATSRHSVLRILQGSRIPPRLTPIIALAALPH